MNKLTYLLAIALLLTACNSNQNQQNNEDTTVQESTEQTPAEQADQKTTEPHSEFSIESLPLSEVDLGEFPFFTAPEGAKYINQPKVATFDFLVFVTPDSMYEVEGKTYRAYIQQDKDSKTEISGRYLFKSYENAILAAGDVKVFEGRIINDRLKNYEKLATYAGSDGSIDVYNNEIVSYVIRRADGTIYITMEKQDFPASSIQIVQEKPFQQTIKKITADDIVKDLTQSGKAVLYINFDVDKADITSEGKSVVKEIAGALKKEPTLKISIEGHTDNTGDAAHNKTLSLNRANAVLNQLLADDIESSRLSAKGFGAEKPLVANDSEENKAKNRRVELIKVD